MSELYSEMHDKTRDLTIRVKVVDLDAAGVPVETLSPNPLPKKRLSSRVAIAAHASFERDRRTAEHPRRPRESSTATGRRAGEVCACTGKRIPAREFETHLTSCVVCTNRAALQRDFVKTVEVAIHQRRAEALSQKPACAKIQGAMLIGAPALNFAICGEIELDH